MRPADSDLRQKLWFAMRRGPATAAELAATVGTTDRTVRRIIAEWQTAPGVSVQANQGTAPNGNPRPEFQQVLAHGEARARRYALTKPLPPLGQTQWPLYAIDESGRAEMLSTVTALQAEGSHCVLNSFAVCGEANDTTTRAHLQGWWQGLPHALSSMAPQGFLGRLLGRAHAATLGIPPEPNRWSDEHTLRVLAQVADDTSGNLVLGDACLERVLARMAAPQAACPADDTPDHYATLTTQIAALGPPGRSAAGDFPKFATSRELLGSATPEVIVKFSGPRDDSSNSRWADMLVCEHLALQTLRNAGVGAAKSRILQHAGRTFLELERFDRAGAFGRKPLMSLFATSNALLGMIEQDWPEQTAVMLRKGWLSEADHASTQLLWHFGQLIANTDMHSGNLSFHCNGQGFSLSPAYDMLPMAFAPLPGGELRNPLASGAWLPKPPLPRQRAPWAQAAQLAQQFWQTAASDSRISTNMRANATLAAHQVTATLQRFG